MESIILMAGSGTRLGLGYNKCLYDLNGRLVFTYSLRILKKYSEKVILVIKEEELPFIKEFLDDKVDYVIGGSERYLSVYNGVIKSTSKYVLVHDGARPFINTKHLEELINLSQCCDAVFSAEIEKNTVYYDDDNLKPLNRQKVVVAKTPQIFKRDLFLEAFSVLDKEKFVPTDDISLLLNYDNNLKIKYLLDDGSNFKITNKIDLELAKLVSEND